MNVCEQHRVTWENCSNLYVSVCVYVCVCVRVDMGTQDQAVHKEMLPVCFPLSTNHISLPVCLPG